MHGRDSDQEDVQGAQGQPRKDPHQGICVKLASTLALSLPTPVLLPTTSEIHTTWPLQLIFRWWRAVWATLFCVPGVATVGSHRWRGLSGLA